jgi:hypothetical protein
MDPILVEPRDDEVLTIPFKRNTALPVLLFVGAIFLFEFIWFFGHWNEAPYYIVHLVGVGLVLMLAVYCMGPNVFYVRLTSQGLQYRYVGRNRFYRWSDVTNIRLLERTAKGVPIACGIAFDLVPGAKQRSVLTGVAKLVSDYHVEIPGVFGRGPKELVALLQTWQSHFATPKNTDSHETPAASREPKS